MHRAPTIIFIIYLMNLIGHNNICLQIDIFAQVGRFFPFHVTINPKLFGTIL